MRRLGAVFNGEKKENLRNLAAARKPLLTGDI
jgi:hypothetical protein